MRSLEENTKFLGLKIQSKVYIYKYIYKCKKDDITNDDVRGFHPSTRGCKTLDMQHLHSPTTHG